MEYVTLLTLLWFISLPAVLFFWWKKYKAKKSAGINFETDANYLSASRKKNYSDYASIGLFLLTNICGIFLAKDIATAFVFFLWLGSLLSFIVYWRKKRNAKLSGEDEVYKKISMQKRIIGVASVVLFALLVQFSVNPEWIMNEEEIVAYAEKQKAKQEKLAAEKAEQERLAAEKAEQEKLAAEKAEQEKLAAEKAEQEKLTAEKAEQERLAAEKAEQEKLAAEKAEQERLAAEKKAQEDAENQRRKEQIKEYAGKAKDYLSEKAENLANAGIEKIKQEVKEFTASEIYVGKMKNIFSGKEISDTDVYVLPRTVEPLMEGIIFETREGYSVKVKIVTPVGSYTETYLFYNNNNFFESEDKIYYSVLPGNGRQEHITYNSTALEIYNASKKFSLLK